MLGNLFDIHNLNEIFWTLINLFDLFETRRNFLSPLDFSAFLTDQECDGIRFDGQVIETVAQLAKVLMQVLLM